MENHEDSLTQNTDLKEATGRDEEESKVSDGEEAKVSDGEETKLRVKTYTCPICSRSFCSWEANLRRHYREKHQRKRFKCTVCWQSFTRNDALKRHVKTKHPVDVSTNSVNVTTSPTIVYQEVQTEPLDLSKTGTYPYTSQSVSSPENPVEQISNDDLMRIFQLRSLMLQNYYSFRFWNMRCENGNEEVNDIANQVDNNNNIDGKTWQNQPSTSETK